MFSTTKQWVLFNKSCQEQFSQKSSKLYQARLSIVFPSTTMVHGVGGTGIDGVLFNITPQKQEPGLLFLLLLLRGKNSLCSRETDGYWRWWLARLHSLKTVQIQRQCSSLMFHQSRLVSCWIPLKAMTDVGGLKGLKLIFNYSSQKPQEA